MRRPSHGHETTAPSSASNPRWAKSLFLFTSNPKGSEPIFFNGVLFNSREPLRMAAVDTFAEIGVEVTVEDFVPFMGTVSENFNPLDTLPYAKPNPGIGFSGALELIAQLKVTEMLSALPWNMYLDFNKEESELQTLELKGVQPPAPKSRTLKRLRNQSSVDKETAEADGGSSSEGNLCLKISLPVKLTIGRKMSSEIRFQEEVSDSTVYPIRNHTCVSCEAQIFTKQLAATTYRLTAFPCTCIVRFFGHNLEIYFP
ncbi:hypothetical protein SADUNF_Sadunf05G0007000 [Salix dunnii]|uniref:Uncharacterized protein n=1 Tax=Salix dunnii TaxID=1413687 RepID=A0A835K6B4_9ROSI|nr:hypothetical protein SADUNF_Sadunf05G0007000 [Salix dunnii]